MVLKQWKSMLKNIEYGAQRIAWGLAKKLILADGNFKMYAI